MITALAVEYAKLRRTKTLIITAFMATAIVLFSSMQLFSPSYAAKINDPLTAHWGGMLLGYAMIKSMMMPIFLAVLASRIVDPEHQGNGWLRASINGWAPGRLCLVKTLALAPLLALTTALELGALIGLSRLKGATTPVPTGPWAWYAAASFVVSVLLLAASIWLAATVDSQLVILGVGVLGGFIGVFSMLMPPWLTPLTPWGYYAVPVPVQMQPLDDRTATYVPVDPPLLTLGVFLVVATAVLWLAFNRLNRKES